MGSWEYVDERCDWSFLDPEDDVETYQANCNCPCSAGRSQNSHRSPPEGCIHDQAPPPLQPHEKAEDEPSTSAGPPLLGKTESSNGVSGYQERVQPTDSKPLLESHSELTSLTHSENQLIVQPRVPEVRKFVKKKPEAAPRVRRIPPPPRSSSSQLPRPGIITRTIGTSGPNIYCGLLGVFSKDCACQRYRAERDPKPNTKSIGVQCELRSPGWLPSMPDLRFRPVKRQ
ncbi:hypothetical protein WA026_004240 [Henosepilachna vigintioctopunctata]|uniref:Uncharacterized protein n=1 Tax=Henosepilachna vigintioctopunctata TaxID=420089 RepID=A0AAW1UZZ0_9CUCU